MDVDAVADELYGLRPDEFTETRNERMRQARSRGDRDAATRIGRLRKPTASAWVVNRLLREQREEMEQLLQLGEQLRAAQGELRGADLRTLSQQRSQVVSALARQGRQLAREAGRPVSEAVGREVEGTLEAALADQDAAADVRSGRLTAALSYSGLGPLGATTGARGQADVSAGQGQAKRPGAKRAAPDRGEKSGDQQADGEERDRRRIEQAERSLTEAEEAARGRGEERDRARAEEDDARSRRNAADEQVAQLERELERAREEAAAAAERLGDASRHREDADRALSAAQEQVRRAGDELERLSGGSSGRRQRSRR